MEKKSNTRVVVGGIIFTGCMFIGMGLGMYYYRLVEGLFIGMGVGFLAMGVAWALIKKD